METIKKYADIAKLILNDKIRYKSNKEIISRVFKIEHDDKIMFRLTIIDSYYSTQMNKRLYGLESIARELEKFNNDNELILEINKFLDNPNQDGRIKELFTKTYGFDKRAKNRKKAISLLSKYFYFVTNYKFPIYDNLGLVSYKLLKKKKLISTETISEENYFRLIIKLNKKSGINDFDKLDNFLWLLGKLTEGSFSILMSKEKYEALVNQIKFPENLKSNEIDTKIRNFIVKHYKNLDFSENEKKFFEFAFK